MADHMKKVQSGNPLVIPAQAYNAFIDAAVDYRHRTAHIGQKAEPSSRQAGIILVRNDSGSDQNRLAVLGIDTPIIDPASNDSEFKNRVALSCVTPAADTHEGKFVILAEPIASGKIGRAYVCRSTCRTRTTSIPSPRSPTASPTTSRLPTMARPRSFGVPAASACSGPSCVFVRLGKWMPTHIFPVDLTQVGGAQGDETNPAT